ncbi:MAG: hypothetical protein HONDAALG_02874 [Gammaproteobacteria bacterium]|nr:hypothetical protein [Gammaproteobacteria bacterium]
MRIRRRWYSHWQPPETQIYNYDSGLGNLPIILLSAFGIAITANGISLMTGASFLFGLLVSLTLSGLKLYFLLRYEPRYEQRVPNRRDKVLGYVILVILLAVTSAFGLYGLGNIGNLAALTPNDDISLMTFFNATRAKDTYAIICWFVTLVVEMIVFMIAARDHQEYGYMD